MTDLYCPICVDSKGRYIKKRIKGGDEGLTNHLGSHHDTQAIIKEFVKWIYHEA